MADERKNTEILLPKDGEVEFEAPPPEVGEEEISDEIDFLTAELDSIHESIIFAMQDFQAEWDKGPFTAFKRALDEGAEAGSSAWMQGMADTFSKESLENVARWISETGATVLDVAASNARERYRQIEQNIAEGNYFSISWWWKEYVESEKRKIKAIEDAFVTVRQGVTAAGDAIGSGLTAAQKALISSAEYASKIAHLYKNRETIAKLPELLAEGEVEEIQKFIENELMKIDPDIAQAIMGSPEFHAVLELINDPDTMTTYLAYVMLVFDAIPLNFYAYVTGKAGSYIVCEIILLIVLSLVSAGTATAGRVALLLARMGDTAVRAGKVGKTIKNAAAAVRAFQEVVRRLLQAADSLQKIGHMLARARLRGAKIKGSSKTTLAVKRQSLKRKGLCRICGTGGHKTPRNIKRGSITYYTPMTKGALAAAGVTAAFSTGRALTEKEKSDRLKAAREDEQEQAEAQAEAEALAKEPESNLENLDRSDFDEGL